MSFDEMKKAASMGTKSQSMLSDPTSSDTSFKATKAKARRARDVVLRRNNDDNTPVLSIRNPNLQIICNAATASAVQDAKRKRNRQRRAVLRELKRKPRQLVAKKAKTTR